MFEDAQSDPPRCRALTGSIFAETQLARLALVRGDVDAAVEDLGRSRRRGGAVGSAPFALEAWIYLAESLRQNEANGERALDDPRPRPNARSGSSRHQLAAHLARVRATALRPFGRRRAAHPSRSSSALVIARRQRLLYEEEQALRVLADLRPASGEEVTGTRGAGRGERLAQRLAAMS